MQTKQGKYAVGVDIGGTKIAAAIINHKGEMHHRKQIPSPTKSAQSMLVGVIQIIQEVLTKAELTLSDIVGIGVGVPGKVDEKKGIAIHQNNIPWENFPLVDELKKAFPETLITIDNDVKVAAYAEYRNAYLRAEEVFVYFTISTGLATTIIVNNQIIRGAGFSGEIGFIPTGEAEPYHTLEKKAAGPGVQLKAQELYKDNSLSTADVFAYWQQGKEPAKTIVDESIASIANAIYHIICLLDPTAITLGGSVVIKNIAYMTELKRYLTQWLHPEQAHVLDRINLSTLGSNNGIIGAALLVMDQA